ncbi:hypothetical protein ACFPRL_31855 [Pseudoclavibacter helvolus]
MTESRSAHTSRSPHVGHSRGFAGTGARSSRGHIANGRNRCASADSTNSRASYCPQAFGSPMLTSRMLHCASMRCTRVCAHTSSTSPPSGVPFTPRGPSTFPESARRTMCSTDVNPGRCHFSASTHSHANVASIWSIGAIRPGVDCTSRATG